MSMFIQLFFPEASQAIDFTHIKFLQQEVFTDVTAGEKHMVDILVEARLKEEPGLILVNVEPQSYIKKDFHERMFIYFSRLYEKYRRKILPIAVFSYEQWRDEPDSFKLGFHFLEVLRFSFYKLELKKLSWREYIHSDNPVAAALLSKMGFAEEEKVRIKVEFMRMLTRLKLNPADMELIAGFFETYLRLNRQEEEEFYREMDRIDQKEAKAIMQITTSWHEKGRTEGKLEAKQEVICKYLTRRFGLDCKDIQEKMQQLTDMEVLDNILAGLFATNSLAEAQNIIKSALDKFQQ